MRPETVAMRRRAFLAGVTGLTSATAGCGLLPEESEPIEASASAPASLPSSAASEAGYSQSVSEETTLKVSVTVDLSGDVEITNTREVVATVFRRSYAADDGRRFGVVTAPAVAVYDQPSIVRDPITALDDTRAIHVATDTSVSSVSDWEETDERTVLGTETTRETATATADDESVRLSRVRVRADDDAVTAIAVTPTDTDADPPFAAIVRDA